VGDENGKSIEKRKKPKTIVFLFKKTANLSVLLCGLTKNIWIYLWSIDVDFPKAL